VRRGDGAFGSLCAGKYLDVAAAVDIARDPELAEKLMQNPRGRMDDYSWGKTLYRYRSAGDAVASKETNPTLFEASKNFEGSDPTMFEDSNE